MKPTRERGRPPGSGAKAAGEKFVAYTFRLPPDLLEELRQQVPAAGRAEFIRRALARELGWPREEGS